MSIQQEKQTVAFMIEFYCKRNHKHTSTCPICLELIDYAQFRLDKCTFDDAKPSCNKCTIHCYKPTMRERIRKVMRYSGPRMVYAFPLYWVRHWIKIAFFFPKRIT